MIEPMKYANIISPFGLGDTFILCMLRNAIEEKYHVRVCYWIKASHVFIAEMFGAEYKVRIFDDEELINLSKKSKVIEEGCFFVAHPHFIDLEIEQSFFEHRIEFLAMYENILGLDNDKISFNEPQYPMVTDSLMTKISPFKPDEVILFAPEMTSCVAKMDIPNQNWLKKYMTNYDTNKIMINACKTEDQVYEGRYLDLTLSELVALAINCREVISVRSGLCDLIYQKVRKMTVLYANVDVFANYSLKTLFRDIKENHAVDEKIISYENELCYRGYSNCAIYGMGKNGRRLYSTLKEADYPVLYSIDKNSKAMSTLDIDILPNYGPYPKVDCIISTVPDGFEEVKENLLRNGYTGAIIDFWNMEYHNNCTELLARSAYRNE